MHKKQKSSTKSYKREATSVILIGLGVILILAILSYDRTDNPNLDIENNSIKIKNWLGPLGAAIADPLIKYTLGYPIIVLPMLIIFIALKIYRGIGLSSYIRPILLLLVWAFVFSIILALPEAFRTAGELREYYPSGLLGGLTSGYLILYLGKLGSILSIFIVMLALSILSLRLEIDKLLDGIIKYLNDLYTEILKITQLIKQKIEKRKLYRRQQNLNRLKRKDRGEEKLPPEKAFEIPKPPQIKVFEEQKYENEALTRKPGENVAASPTSPLPLMKEKTIPQADDMEFEVEQVARVDEVDYDKLVRESLARYQFPSIDLLELPVIDDTRVTREELQGNAGIIEAKLAEHGVSAKVIRVTAGPVITLYELQPAPGIKVSQIVALATDLALIMEARGIRMVAPIPGKAAIGIEIPNRNPQIVYLKSLIRSETYAQSNFILPLALGKTINGEVYCADLTKMPHLLMAGSTGSGKSVGINTIIASILYKVDPGKVKFVLIDPKKIELSLYKALSEHYLIWRSDLDEEVITTPSNAVSILNTIVLEMENRYDKLAHLGVRNIEDYNERVRQGGPRIKEEKLQQLPYIIVIIDELADLMMVAAKEVENPIARLTQMARAVGIHLILATQRPSVDVITGVIKANFPARIAYMVTTRPDSKTILDMNGAEQLLGNGDMLYQPPGEPRPIRLQNPLISTKEVERIIAHIKSQPKLPHYSLPQPKGTKAGIFDLLENSGPDELYDEAKRIVVQNRQGSISFLQRRLKIGYSRAARLIDNMEEEGVVGPADGSKPRQVILLPEDL